MVHEKGDVAMDKPAMPQELVIPQVCYDQPSVEMIRVWLADQRQHCVLNIGLWEDRGLDKRAAWGLMIADMVHHIANAHAEEYGHDREESIRIIWKSFETEMGHPTTERIGDFVKDRKGQSDASPG